MPITSPAFIGAAITKTPALLEGLAAHRVLPPFPVSQSLGMIPFATMERTVLSCRRGPDGAVQSISSDIGEVEVDCTEHAVETPIRDARIVMLGGAERAHALVAIQLTRPVLIAREMAAAELLFSTATFDAAHRVDIAAGKEWNALLDAGKAVDDLESAIGKLTARGFNRARLSLLLSDLAYSALKRNVQVRAQVQGSGPALTGSSIAALLDIKEIIIAGEAKTAILNANGGTFAPIWNPKMALLAFIDSGAEPSASLGHTFVHDDSAERSKLAASAELPSNPALLIRSTVYRNEGLRADVVRVQSHTDIKLTNVDAGCLITGCTV